MKKCILFIILFCLILNVKAVEDKVCVYNIDDVNYSLTFTTVRSFSWTLSYKFNNSYDDKYLVNENSKNISNYLVKNPKIVRFYDTFVLSYDAMKNGTCPVLVFLNSNEYSIMPYELYIDYFALNIIDDDHIKIKTTVLGLYETFTLENICGYYNAQKNSRNPDTSLLLLEYLKNNSHYDELISKCSNKEGIDGTLKDYFSTYETDFIVGQEGDLTSLCPLNNGKNAISDITKCLFDKGDTVENAIEDFKNKCTEKEMLAIQSYGSGTLSTFYEKGNISSYLDNEIKMLFKSFSSECSASADNLYKLVANLGSSMYAYYLDEEINNTISYLYVESQYLSGYGFLTSPNQYVKIVDDACQLISSDLKKIILDILDALKIGGIVIVIFLSIVEVYKMFIASEKSNKMLSVISKRVIILILLLLLPTIVNILLDYLNKFIPVDTSSCIVDTTQPLN